ncbi:UNVERIFIED_CONTAM: Dihydrolipoyl dehydrogenase 1, mitochondrial [Sesamum radiatum]|uniref:Dihydrolipoyl dehydrogenase 1, mitochondrial n=1 Tax=Sesamum radiatum TaxID=300843 RepID=A0AAW2SNL2_SESRA
MAMASIARRRTANLFSSSSKHLYNYSWILTRGFASGSDDNDVVVIGGGPGGYVAAIKAAQLGLKTTCIEKRGTLGGTCLNVGCIPSKALLHSSHMYHEAKHSFASHGVKLASVEVDLPAMMAQKDKAVGNLTKGIEGLFKKNKALAILVLKWVLSGGGLGQKVTVVEFASDIVPTMDGEVRKQFQRSLEKQKMKFMLKTKVVSVDTTGNGVKLTLEPAAGGDQTTLEADVVLVSAGRTPFTAGLQLEKIGVETDKAGRILVNERFATNIPGVYAIGDVIPGPMLAHKAEEDGVACVEYIAGKEGHVDYDMVPGVVYTHPEVASVGKTEEQVKALGVDYRVGKFPFMANSRAKAIDDAEGLVKILAEKETDKILGVHIMAPNAGELIHEAVLALHYGASSEDIARTCHAHPTMSEALKEAAMATYDKPIHI